MEVLWNNSKDWNYIAHFSLKPQIMIPTEELFKEDIEWRRFLPSKTELQIIDIPVVDNSPKALKRRLKWFKTQ